MELTLKHYGSTGGSPSSLIELIIIGNYATIEEDITDRNGNVDVHLINSLREIADELEEQNKLNN